MCMGLSSTLRRRSKLKLTLLSDSAPGRVMDLEANSQIYRDERMSRIKI
jgi:hypothetical protein